MAKSISLLSRFKAFFAIFLLVAIVFITVPEAWAKRPPEIRNQDDLNIRQDMHGEDLSGYEFVKFDLRGIDFSDSDLTGAVFNNSKLNGADLHGAGIGIKKVVWKWGIGIVSCPWRLHTLWGLGCQI